ncbi:nitrogen regulation protein NR(II) [Thiomicrospira sp. R3]|uniref:nitrogen regulation protein NR(II) n=1 Tax=Thiomicrospira sp. R3 TaxID=3035472 RepID=UPI00259B6506|nr:nitrogen regulation protein NR(II) [Thiomicrospira sp. R3]WFE68688.1 nitrogen regulation protein NR(II) [Thiomicrospira sp. R3]
MQLTPRNVAWDELLDGLATAVIWVDDQQKIGYLNIAAAQLLQVSTRRIIGVAWKVLLPGLVDDLTSFGEQRLTIHEYQIHLPDLQRVRVSCTFSCYEVGGGWLVELFNTERHHRIVEEDERWHQYEAGNILVKTLAHEVKNPLAGIYGAAQLLQKRFQDDQKAISFLDVISKEVQRLKNLVDSMLGPRQTAEKEWHNIHEVIRHVLRVTKPELSQKIQVMLDYDPSIPEIRMDFETMIQAFLNLIKNAMQAMEGLTGLITIRTRVERKFTLGTQAFPLVAVVSIHDEGSGIPKEVFDSMFYPMVSSKKAGTGLGLPVSQNIIRQHGGLIVAESEVGHTVFHVYIPFDRGEK